MDYLIDCGNQSYVCRVLNQSFIAGEFEKKERGIFIGKINGANKPQLAVGWRGAKFDDIRFDQMTAQ